MERKRILDNGVEMFDYLNEHNHSFFISLFLRAGSMYETKDESGITHFYEHIAIRNVNYLMNGGLYADLDKYGLDFNAGTYAEMVRFYISGACCHFRRAVELFSGLFSPISLPSSEIDAERRRVKAEIREDSDVGSLTCFTQREVFGDCSLSLPITGTAGSVNRIGVKRLEEFRRRAFSAGNLFFYVTGCVSDEDLDYMAEVMGKLTVYDGKRRSNIAPVPSNFGKRCGRVALKNASFTKVCFTFDVDMQRVTLPEGDLLYSVVLSGYNSDFFIELSEKRGLFYDLGGNFESFINIGTLSFSFEIRESRLYEAVQTAVELLCKYREEIPEQRFLKAAYVDNAELLLDEPRELNFTFAYDNHIIGQGYPDVAARRAAYSAVSRERLSCVAKEVFCTDNLTLTLKGARSRVDVSELSRIIKKLEK